MERRLKALLLLATSVYATRRTRPLPTQSGHSARRHNELSAAPAYDALEASFCACRERRRTITRAKRLAANNARVTGSGTAVNSA